MGKEAAGFVLNNYGIGFIGSINEVPDELRKILKPKEYSQGIIICEGAILPVARVLKENLPKYRNISLNTVEKELRQTPKFT